MDRTHILHRLKCVIATHGFVLEALGMSAALGFITAHDIAPGAHFLQRAPAVTRQHVTTAARRPKPRTAPTTATERAAERRVQRTIARLTTVADASQKPYLAIEPLREAAPPEVQTFSSASSSAAAVRLPISSASSAPAIVEQIAEPVIIEIPEVSADPQPDFPAFGRAMHPVGRVPDWGAMTTPVQWNRSYKQMAEEDFVRTPAYDLHTLTEPMNGLLKNRHDADVIKTLTAKLYYSTRFFGAYDLDAGEFSAVHPGIDLKLAEDTPVGTVAGGRVHDVRTNERSLGLHVIVEHRAPDGHTYYSIYGHLESASVRPGDTVTAGQMIGIVGITGNTTGPHLHLQIDRGEPGSTHHEIYWPDSVPSRSEADKHTVNPIVFIRQFADGR